jgi:hypothetical protein
MKSSSLLCVVAMVAGAACGSVSNPKADANTGGMDMAAAGDFSIAAGTPSLSQAIAGKVDVTIDLTRGEGFSDAVALTATGLPTGVTSEFSLSSVPSDMTASTLTLTIDSAASAGTTDITVTGVAGSLTHTAVVSLELHTSTIAGKVRGVNQANVPVRIVGKTAVISDGSGNFTFTDVKLPYDIYVIGETGASTNPPIPAINYYKGLTRLDPVVTEPKQFFFTVIGIFGSSGRIQGTKSGAGNSTDPMFLSWSTGGSDAVSGTTAYDFNGSWSPTAASKAGTLGVLQVKRGVAGTPTAYYYADVNTTLSQGTTSGTNIVNAVLTALATTYQITGAITVPGGFTTPKLSLSQQIQGKTHEIWAEGATTNATALVPSLAGQKASFYAVSNQTGEPDIKTEYVYPGLSAATDVSYTLASPAGITGPVDGVDNVTASTTFDFTTTPNQVYVVTFSNGTATYFLHTTAASNTIPSVPEMMLPTGAMYTWRVSGYGPYADINAAADPVNIRGVGKAEYDGTPHFQTSNPARDFTTQ